MPRYFDVDLNKDQRVSDWMADELSEEQLRYAADDVRYLWPLYGELDKEVRRRGLVVLRDGCYAHLATHTELELRGYPDVFEY
jgi:ribonuclease D